MDDVFGELPPEGQPAPQGEAQPPAQQPQEPEQPQQPPPEEPGTAAPPAASTDRHVPLEALEAVRGERNDWKSRTTKAETERDMLRQQLERLERQQPGGGQPQLTEAQIAYNERLNTAEMLLRDRHSDVDEVVGVFMEAANKNPGLRAQMDAQLNPWKFAYEEGKRLKFASEIGNDPEAYRKKVRAEIEAEMRGAPAAAATPQSPTPAAPRLPESLAGAKSSGARSATWTGPTPFESLFPN